VRFIEFMPLDADRAWDIDQVLTGEEIRAAIAAVWPLEPLPREPSATARVFRFADGRGQVGFVNPVTGPKPFDFETVVPGHGPVTTPAYLATQRAVLLDWTSAVAEAVAKGWSREETIERVDFRDKFGPVDVGQGYMMDHIQTLNAASLWDKFTAKRAPVR